MKTMERRRKKQINKIESDLRCDRHVFYSLISVLHLLRFVYFLNVLLLDLKFSAFDLIRLGFFFSLLNRLFLDMRVWMSIWLPGILETSLNNLNKNTNIEFIDTIWWRMMCAAQRSYDSHMRPIWNEFTPCVTLNQLNLLHPVCVRGLQPADYMFYK